MSLVLILTLFFFSLVSGFLTIPASAEELHLNGENNAKISISTNDTTSETEIPETENSGEFTSLSYIYSEEGYGTCIFTLVDKTTLLIDVSFEDGSIACIKGTYVLEGNKLYVYANDTWLGNFELQRDGRAIPIEYEDSEEVSEEDSNRVIIDEELDKYLQPIICACAGLSGTIAVVSAVLIFWKKIKKKIVELVKWWKEKKEELATEGFDLKEIRESISNAIISNEEVKSILTTLATQNAEQYQAFVTTVKRAVDTAVELVEEMKVSYDKRAEILEMQYKQIKEILIMMASGNTELVRRGTADQIVKKFEVERKNEKGK